MNSVKVGVFFLVCTLALPAWAEPTTTETAAYSRQKILPLVSTPGKQRGLFATFHTGETSTWNPEFWGASLGFDQFTGIGWGTECAGVLVTPEHVLSAGHYGNNATKGVHFYDQQGTFLGYRALARNAEGKAIIRNLPHDIRVARLEHPAPPGARIYPLPDPKTYERRLAWSTLPKNQLPLLIATDWRNPKPKKTKDPEERQRWRITRSAHPVRLAPPHTSNKGFILRWTHGRNGDPAVHPSYHEVINKGDSSHPLFWVTKSGLVLASTFTGVNSGPNYGHPEIQASIQEAIDALGGQEQHSLRFTPVP